MGIRYAIEGDLMTDWEEGIKTFCNAPRESFFLGFILDVAGGQIDPEEVASNVIEEFRVVCTQILQGSRCFADDQTQLNLMVESHASWPNDRTAVRQKDRRGRLEEEERLRRTSGGEFSYVVSVAPSCK